MNYYETEAKGTMIIGAYAEDEADARLKITVTLGTLGSLVDASDMIVDEINLISQDVDYKEPEEPEDWEKEWED